MQSKSNISYPLLVFRLNFAFVLNGCPPIFKMDAPYLRKIQLRFLLIHYYSLELDTINDTRFF